MRNFLLGAALLIAFAPTQAGPPFVTDDPEPPLPGGWEINVLCLLECTPAGTANGCAIAQFALRTASGALKVEFSLGVCNLKMLS